MIQKVVGGGQTGADRGGLDAAIRLGIPHGGYCPKGRRAEDGRIPERYLLEETLSFGYEHRTMMNVSESTGTVIFVLGKLTPGSSLTLWEADIFQKPSLLVRFKDFSFEFSVKFVQDWIRHHDITNINIAGTRESKAPGIQKRVEEVMYKVLFRKKKPKRREEMKSTRKRSWRKKPDDTVALMLSEINASGYAPNGEFEESFLQSIERILEDGRLLSSKQDVVLEKIWRKAKGYR